MTQDDLATFHQQLITNLDENEFKTLVFYLDLISYDHLSGDNQSARARALLSYLRPRHKLSALQQCCQKHFPEFDWIDVTYLDTPSPPITTSSPTVIQHNPFHSGGRINDPNLFFGRARLLREIQSELSKHTSVSLVGDTQMGKSSLLYYLYQTRTQWAGQMRVEYFDLQRVLDEEDFCETLLERLGQQGHTLRQLKRPLAKYEGVMLFDEMERLTESDFNPRLHDLLRAQAQERHFALCLATRHPLDALFADDRPISAFYNIFTTKWLRPFTPTEAYAFLDFALANNTLTFTQPERDQLVKQSGGHPAELQRLAKKLYDEKHYGEEK